MRSNTGQKPERRRETEGEGEERERQRPRDRETESNKRKNTALMALLNYRNYATAVII